MHILTPSLYRHEMESLLTTRILRICQQAPRRKQDYFQIAARSASIQISPLADCQSIVPPVEFATYKPAPRHSSSAAIHFQHVFHASRALGLAWPALPDLFSALMSIFIALRTQSLTPP